MLGIGSSPEGNDQRIPGRNGYSHDPQCLCLQYDDIQEAQASCHEFPEESYEVVSRFVQFCYLWRYDTVGPATTKYFEDRQLQDRKGVIHSLQNGSTSVMISQWPRRRSDNFSSGALFQGGPRQAEHENSLPSAEKLAHELNGRRFCLDVAMYRIADMYNVQSLRLHAFEKLRDRLYEYLHGHGTADPILYAIAPIYACTSSGDSVLRPMILRVLEAYKGVILADPLLWSRLFWVSVDVDDFGQDYRRIFDVTDHQWQTMFIELWYRDI